MLFEEQISRKPDLYPFCKEYINTTWAGFWTANEFSFASDIQDFKVSLSIEEKDIITKTLACIGQVEIDVKRFWSKLGDNLPHPSIVDLGAVIANSEVIHNLAYEKLLNVLGMDGIFEENLKVDILASRVNYLKKHTHKFHKDSKRQFIYSLILFTLFVENVSLFSQFYIVLWFGRFRNLLKDTNQQVLYSSKEENIHAQVGIKLINTLKEEYPDLFDKELEFRIYKETQEAFESESKIIDWIIGDFKSSNLDKDCLKEYIKNRLNQSLVSIGYEKIFTINEDILDKTNWADEELLGNSMTDFFYKKPIEYSKSHASFDSEELY